jgi:hypothetical protein
MESLPLSEPEAVEEGPRITAMIDGQAQIHHRAKVNGYGSSSNK